MFSASAWEKHIHKHSQDGLPIFPNDPAFTQLSPDTLPSTSGSIPKSLPLEVILERAKVVKQCLKEHARLPHPQNVESNKVLSKRARNKEMSRFPKLTQVTTLSDSNWLLTQVTLSFLEFLQIKFIVFFHHFKVVRAKLNYYSHQIVK